MADTSLDIRQSQTRVLQDQLSLTTITRMDSILASINKELTAPGRLIAQTTPNLIVTVGPGTVVNPNTLQNRILPLINNVQVTFAGGTITFPSTSGTITVSPGVNASITIGANKFVAVLIQLTSAGLLNLVVGAEASSLGTVIYPTGDTAKLSLGYIIVQSNGSSVIQNITNAMIYKSVGVNIFGGTLTSPLPVSSGGTGATSFASTGILQGNGSGAISVVPGLTSQNNGTNRNVLQFTDSTIGNIWMGIDQTGFAGSHDMAFEQNIAGANISFYINGASPNPWWMSIKAAGALQLGGASGPLLTTSGADLITSGAMGIGGFAPVQQLHVDGGAAGGVGIKLTNNGSGHTLTDGFSIDMDSSQEVHFRLYEGSDNRGFYWHTNNGTDQRMRLTGDGSLTVNTWLGAGGQFNAPTEVISAWSDGSRDTRLLLANTNTGKTEQTVFGNNGVFARIGMDTSTGNALVGPSLSGAAPANDTGAYGLFIETDAAHNIYLMPNGKVQLEVLQSGGINVGNTTAANNGAINFINNTITNVGTTGTGPQIAVGGTGSNPYSTHDLIVSLDGGGAGFGIISNSGTTTLFGVNASGNATALGTLQVGGFSGPIISNSGGNLVNSGGLNINGNLLFTTDALYSIGNPSSGRPQSIYLTDRAFALAFSSTSTGNPATIGALRLGRPELIVWRDQAGTGNNTLGVDSSNALVYNGTTIVTGSGDFNLNGQLIQTSNSTTGTYHSMANTDTGGRTFTLSSTGSGNSEGAGSFILVDVTASNARRMIIDPSGNFTFKGPSFTFDDPTNAAQNPYLAQGSYSGINKLLLVGDKIQFEASDGPILSRIAPFRLRVEDQLQISSGPVLTANGVDLVLSNNLFIGTSSGPKLTNNGNTTLDFNTPIRTSAYLTLDAGTSDETILGTSANILYITGGGYAGILGVNGTSRAGLAAPADNALAVRNSTTGAFYTAVVGAAINTSTALRIIRGGFNSAGTPTKGEGFTCNHDGTGAYTVTLTGGETFADSFPVAIACPGQSANNITVSVAAISNNSVTFHSKNAAGTGIDLIMEFLIIGIRGS